MAKSACDRAKQLTATLISQYAKHPMIGPGLWELTNQQQWYSDCRRLCGIIMDCAKGQPNENELTNEKDELLQLLGASPDDNQRRQIHDTLEGIMDSLSA
jgi:hypothetical protein